MKKIEFHYTYLIVAVGFILTGCFSNLLIFTSIILIHELGHYLVARYHKQEVSKIIIYPYGGITKINMKINTDINKELSICLAGVLFQSIYFLIILILFEIGVVRSYTYDLFEKYHYALLFFNLLPIIPLDGSKILNLVLSKYLNLKLSNKLNVFISVITILILLIIQYYQFNYTIIFIISFLIDSIVKYYKNLNYYYQKFMLERYLYNFNFTKTKVIKDKNKMYKNCRHIFRNGNGYLTEKSFLKKMFDLK